jgi:hypothetical protein
MAESGILNLLILSAAGEYADGELQVRPAIMIISPRCRLGGNVFGGNRKIYLRICQKWYGEADENSSNRVQALKFTIKPRTGVKIHRKTCLFL